PTPRSPADCGRRTAGTPAGPRSARTRRGRGSERREERSSRRGRDPGAGVRNTPPTQRLPHELETVLSPEELITDREARRARRTERDGALGGVEERLLRLGRAPEERRVERRLAQARAQHLGIRGVAIEGPARAHDRVYERTSPFVGDEQREPQPVHGAQREVRGEPERDAP